MASKPSRQLQPQAEGHAHRDRPWLLPSNRKLRNLVSISLRNLSIHTTSPTRHRKKTIDDDAVPNTLKSPAKLFALREQKAFGHSRSSSDLRSVAENAVIDSEDGVSTPIRNGGPQMRKGQGNGTPHTPQRPTIPRMRRRSTLEWANATPQRRQEKLENVIAERMADACFTLHVPGLSEPVYISETVERTMNPSFRHIDLAACGPGITRIAHLTLRLWIKATGAQHWRQLLELSSSMDSLQYIGKTLEHLQYPLPQNAVIFHLEDGVYISLDSLSDYIPPPILGPTRAASSRVLPTSSFDALLRLAKLDDSIQDALSTRDKLAADLESLLSANRTSLSDRDKVAEAEDRLKTIDYAKKTIEKQLVKARAQRAERRASLEARRDLMASDLDAQQQALAATHTAAFELPQLRDEHEVKKKAMQNQRRRICESLQKCYPIRAVPHRSLAFTIRRLYLPNSEDLDAEPSENVAAALGHVAHNLQMLSFYLDRPLPYPVNPRSSSSTITDPVSMLKTNASTTQTYKDERTLRTYPLFSKGVPRFRFEYAVFLLNKDIQILLESAYNVRVLDIRQTLPNLKYLFYVATAGEGELPARKAGGVRGLSKAKGGVGSIAGLSRTGSDDSVSSALSGLLWHSGGRANGKSNGAVESLRKAAGDLDEQAKAG